MKVNHWFAQILYIIIIFITRKKFYKKHLTFCCIGATLYIRNKNRKPNNVPSISLVFLVSRKFFPPSYYVGNAKME